MTSEDNRGISRKGLLKTALVAIPASAVLSGLPALARTPNGRDMTPTPLSCDPDDLTHDQIEGPYFKPGSPLRTTMLDGPGTRLTLTGFVYGINCQPIAGALLDFWQADGAGNYDNAGTKFRGHQLSSPTGAYALTTVVAGLYPGRTRHIHVKVQAPGRPILTTQLYFPGEPRNSSDTLYDPALLMNVATVGSEKRATFDFVLNVPGTPPSQSPGPSKSPSQSPSAPPTGGTWAPYTNYALGARVTYAGLAYACQIAHTSLPGWEPPNTPALWTRV